MKTSRHRGLRILKITFGLLPIIIGFDKFFHVLVDWESYLSPQIASILPFSLDVFLKITAVFEIFLGLFVLSSWTKIAAYIESLWILSITLNLFLLGAYDIALRDFVLALSAFSLAKFSS
ncbi:hypothetical protein HYV56_02380 [Candidatus Peregrinibacteria bacterium]|nr:hypothetical protein [Candidatus Peregrinibacteria bacterium]